MTRVATPENEDYLMMIAEHGTVSQMEKLVGKYQQVDESIKRRKTHEPARTNGTTPASWCTTGMTMVCG